MPLPVDRDWIRKLTGTDRAHVLAPMVDQSDLPFRLQCRRYQTNLCFTPMIHARLFTVQKTYRAKFTLENTPPEDRPLIAQICGSHPEYVLNTIRAIEPYCDGIDLNCGCPQMIAKRGNYGAFLLEQEDELIELVEFLLQHAKVPLSVKVRILPHPETGEPDLERSFALYDRLVDAGIHLLTVHGRTRHQKSRFTGAADWDTMAQVVARYRDRIPIFCNGSVGSYQDVQDLFQQTHCDGVMSSEAILEYPPLFSNGPRVGRVALAREYLDLAARYPSNVGGQGSGFRCLRVHLHRFLHDDLQSDPATRRAIVKIDTLEEVSVALDYVQAKHDREEHQVEDEELSWYFRHRKPQPVWQTESSSDEEEDENPEAVCLFFDDNQGDY